MEKSPGHLVPTLWGTAQYRVNYLFGSPLHGNLGALYPGPASDAGREAIFRQSGKIRRDRENKGLCEIRKEKYCAKLRRNISLSA